MYFDDTIIKPRNSDFSRAHKWAMIGSQNPSKSRQRYIIDFVVSTYKPYDIW